MTPGREPRSPGHYRWVICALLFFAATINYIDRQVIGILKPTLVKEFGWRDERTYAAIVFSFQLAYAIGLLLAGRVMDKLGTRLGFALAVVLWSIAAIAHAGADWFPSLQLPSVNLDAATGFSVVMLTGAAAGFALARFALGLGEAGNFPAAIKTVAEWFPRKERALATGIFNAGANIGALVTPLAVPWITLHWVSSSPPASRAFSGSRGGSGFIARPKSIRASLAPNSSISAATRPKPPHPSRGEICFHSGRRGPSRSASS